MVKAYELFKCPKCGASDWVAHYTVPTSQGITLIIGDNGQPEETDYDGCSREYDANDNEWYECSACTQTIRLDGTADDTPWDTPKPHVT